MKLKEQAQQLKTDIPAIFLSLKDKKTPPAAKLLAGITVAYALSPIDLIPDFIPLLGYLDDIILLPLLIALTIKLIPREVFAQCRQQAAGIWEKGRPQKWYYALPVIAIWLLTFVLLYLIINKKF